MLIKKHSLTSSLVILPFLILVLCSSCMFRQKADMIIHHAKIYTVDGNFSVAEAMAVNGGKIIEVGKNEEILKEYQYQLVWLS